MGESSPAWPRRIRALREARGWTQGEAAEAMRPHADRKLPAADHLLRRWKSWEAGSNKPGPEYAPVIAATLGTVTASIFPPATKTNGQELLAVTGMDTLEIVGRLQASDVNDATIEGLRLTVDKLCSSYASQPAAELIVEGRQWLRRVVDMQQERLSFTQRRETLELAGWLTLLVGCLEYDLGDQQRAESTRRAALSIGKEVHNSGILGWAHEMKAWFALTSGDYRGVLAAGEAGEAAAGDHSVAVQLIAQEAKAYARMGKTDDMNATLERGRVLLDHMPYPENIENHFVVDPLKFDFYAMDCLRHTGDDHYARALANEVIRASTDFNGHERSPMRIAEARITLGVAAARSGELDEALSHGRRALSGERKSLPSIALVSQDLAAALQLRYPDSPQTRSYVDQLKHLDSPP